MKRTIQCMYSCSKCGIVKRKVNIEARTDENVIEWMNTKCAPALSRDHDSYSPLCVITSLDQVWIPLRPNAVKIGEALDPPVAT